LFIIGLRILRDNPPHPVSGRKHQQDCPRKFCPGDRESRQFRRMPRVWVSRILPHAQWMSPLLTRCMRSHKSYRRSRDRPKLSHAKGGLGLARAFIRHLALTGTVIAIFAAHRNKLFRQFRRSLMGSRTHQKPAGLHCATDSTLRNVPALG
jgi:hypothetical protein